ncbi:hypothetical protein M0804_013535 [Polistes exclamans]|nr:hypothetical protein M0804_013535 [Polistes exclamans]
MVNYCDLRLCVTAQYSTAQDSTAEQSIAEQNRTEQSRAEQSTHVHRQRRCMCVVHRQHARIRRSHGVRRNSGNAFERLNEK